MHAARTEDAPMLWQGRGDCAGYYMDYFKCIDQCATKLLFKALD